MKTVNKSLIWFSLFILILGITSCTEKPNKRYRMVSTEGEYLISVWNARSLNYVQSLVNKTIEASNGGNYEISVNKPKKTSAELIELVPTSKDITDWKRVGTVMIYFSNEIFKDRLYADRELFLSYYNSVKQASIDYENPKLGREPYLRLDIYDMGSSENAFGIYSINRLPTSEYYPWAGDESIVKPQHFYMWKGRYYIEIEAFEYADDIYEGMINLAKAVDKKIKSKGEIPKIINLLPKERRIRRSEKYFYEAVALENIDASVDKGNTLNLNEQTSGILAQYIHKKSNESPLDTVRLLLIKYPNQRLAESAYQSYTEFLRENKSLTIESSSSKSITFKKVINRR